MRRRMWQPVLTAAAMALNFFTVASGGSEAALPGAQDTNNTATAKSQSKERREIIRKLIVQTLQVDIRKVRPEARFIEDLGGHSLSLAECRFKIEEAFKLEIPEQDAQKLARVRDVFDYIEMRVKKSK